MRIVPSAYFSKMIAGQGRVVHNVLDFCDY